MLIEEIHDKLYEKFIEPFDAVDNGVNQYPQEVKPAYSRPYDIFSMIEALNPSWNEASVDANGRFLEAVNLASSAFSSVLKGYLNSWLPARNIVQEAIGSVGKPLEDGSVIPAEVLVLRPNCPWKEHLFELEKASIATTGKALPFLYVVYEDRAEGTWRIQTVPTNPDSFESRKPLPEPWRGLRDSELDQAARILGCTFVHRSGFIGGNRTFDGVLAMARAAINF